MEAENFFETIVTTYHIPWTLSTKLVMLFSTLLCRCPNRFGCSTLRGACEYVISAHVQAKKLQILFPVCPNLANRGGYSSVWRYDLDGMWASVCADEKSRVILGGSSYQAVFRELFVFVEFISTENVMSWFASAAVTCETGKWEVNMWKQNSNSNGSCCYFT